MLELTNMLHRKACSLHFPKLYPKFENVDQVADFVGAPLNLVPIQ
jgi:hypothetical protein